MNLLIRSFIVLLMSMSTYALLAQECSVRPTEERQNGCKGAVSRYTLDKYKDNPEGSKYYIDFGDNTSVIELDHSQIKVNPTYTLEHTYDTVSCGVPEIRDENGLIRQVNTFLFKVTAVCPTKDTVIRTINPIRIGSAPQVAFTLPEQVCINQPVTFDNNSKPGYNYRCEGTPTYHWDFGNGNVVDSPDGIVTYSFPAPGTYSVKLSLRQDCGTDEDVHTIKVLNIPRPVFEIGAGTELMVVDDCQNNNFAFSTTARACATTDYLPLKNTSTGGNPSTKFSWRVSPATGASFLNNDLTLPQNSIRFTQPGMYTVSLVVEDQCAAGATGTNSSCVVVKVKGVPAINNITISQQSLCAGGNVSLAAVISHNTTQTVDADISGYRWAVTNADGTPVSFVFNTTAKNLELTNVPAGSYKATFTLYSVCGDASQQKNFTVNPIPVADITLDGQGVCAGNAFTIRSSITADKYEWYENGVLMPNTTHDVTLTKTTPGNYKYDLVATVSQCSTRVSKTVVVSAPLELSLNNPTSMCSGGATNYTIVTDPGASLVWEWQSVGGLTFNTVSGITPIVQTTITNQSTDTIRATLQIKAQRNTCTAEKKYKLLIIPQADFLLPASLPNVCSDNMLNVQIQNNIKIPITVDWSVSDNPGGITGGAPGQKNVDDEFTLSQKLVNPNDAPQPITYTFSARTMLGGCTATSKDLKVTVEGRVPLPAGIPDEKTICSGETLNIVLPAPLSYGWTPSVNADISGAVAGMGTTIADKLVSLNHGTPETITYAVVPQQAGCNGATKDIVVHINPEPVNTVNGGEPVVRCGPNGTVGAAVVSSVVGSTFTWYYENEALPFATNVTSYTVTKNGTYHVYAETPAGCKGKVDFNVIQQDYLHPEVKSDRLSACEGETIMLNLDKPGSVTPGWYYSVNGTTFNAVSTSATYGATQPGYYVSLINAHQMCPEYSDTLQLVFHPAPVPDIAFTSGGTAVCPDEVVRLKALNNSSVPVASYAWALQTLSGTAATLSDAISPEVILQYPAGQGTNVLQYAITVKVTSDNNCSREASTTVTVNPPPDAAFQAEPFYCINTPLVFQNLTPTVPGFALKYTWQYGDGNADINLIDGSHTYNQPDTVDVMLVAATSSGCRDSVSHQVVLVAPPVAAFDLAITPVTGCGPLDVTVRNTSTATAAAYAWDMGNGTTSADRDVVGPIMYPANPYGDTTYTVTLRVTNVCTTTIAKEDVLVRTKPTARFGFNASKACDELPIMINNTSYGNSGNYVFDFGDGSAKYHAPGKNPFPHTFITNAEHDVTYTVRLITSNDCGADTLEQKVLVVPNDVRAFIETQGLTACQHAEVLLVAGGLETNEAGIRWSVGGAVYSQEDSIYHAFNSPGVYSVMLSVEVPVCQSASYDTAQITILRSPDIKFQTPEAICTNESLKAINTGADIDGRTQWNFGNGVVYSGAHPPPVPYHTEGAYTVSMMLRGVNNCETRVEHGIVVGPPPVAAFILTDSVICSARDIHFKNTSAGAASYWWNFNDVYNTASMLINPTHNFSGEQVSSVSLIAYSKPNQQGCSDTTYRSIQIHPTPTAAFVVDTTYTCGVTSLTVENTSQSPADVRYYWQWSDKSELYTSHGVPPRHIANYDERNDKQVYLTMVASTLLGCTDTVKQAVIARSFLVDVFTPTDPATILAFIPGKNGRNSELHLDSENVGSLTLTVFNRWGLQVFESNEVDFSWDGVYRGKLVEPGDYVMRMNYRDCAGRNSVKTKQVPIKVLRE